MQENSSKNTIIQLLIKNKEYLNKSDSDTVSDETFKTVTKGPLKQGNNIEISKINCWKRFEVLSTTDVDDNDESYSRSGKLDNTIINEFLTNDNERNKKKIQQSCITSKKHRKNTLPKMNEAIKAVSLTNKNIKDHHEKLIRSTYSNVVRNKKKNIVLFTDSIMKTLRIGELNPHINARKGHLKLFPGSKAKQLNRHTIPILEEHQ